MTKRVGLVSSLGDGSEAGQHIPGEGDLQPVQTSHDSTTHEQVARLRDY